MTKFVMEEVPVIIRTNVLVIQIQDIREMIVKLQFAMVSLVHQAPYVALAVNALHQIIVHVMTVGLVINVIFMPAMESAPLIQKYAVVKVIALVQILAHARSVGEQRTVRLLFALDILAQVFIPVVCMALASHPTIVRVMMAMLVQNASMQFVSDKLMKTRAFVAIEELAPILTRVLVILSIWNLIAVYLSASA